MRVSLLLPAFASCLAVHDPSGPIAAPRPETGREERFWDWTELDFDASEHAGRRARLLARIRAGGGGVFLAPSRAARSGGETFRQLDDFQYLTGLELPDAVLALDADAMTSTVFAPRWDSRFESTGRPNDFPGRPLTDDPEIAARAGIPLAPREELDRALAEWAADERPLWVRGREAALGEEVPVPETDFVREYTAEEVFVLHIAHVEPDARILNAYEAVARERLVKSPAEIDRIRRACAVTAAGIRHAAGFVRPGVDERTLEGELEAEFKRRGAQRLAFDSIIKSGPNSLWPWRILASHYDRRNRGLRAGDLVIFDVGCELDGYASDVGRTFPASGRFSAEQRAALEMQLAVADAVIDAVRPGVTFEELCAAAIDAMPESARPYMQTGSFFGHHIGLYVGDPNLADLPLEPGMVFTVEPWYYNHDDGISVFVEDVVVVTENGCEVLTSALPRDATSLEAMTAR